MPRKPMNAAEKSRRDALTTANAMSAWVKTKTKPSDKKRPSKWDAAHAQQEMHVMIKSQDWSKASPKHFVELYIHLHDRVYGVAPLEMKVGATKMNAASLASRMLKDHFESPDAMADFMRWVWQQQARQEKKRKAMDVQGDTFRVTWRYQFSPKLVTDYRRDTLVKGGR